MDIASEMDGFGPVMSAVEQCTCPPGFAGTSCEVNYGSISLLVAWVAFNCLASAIEKGQETKASFLY